MLRLTETELIQLLREPGGAEYVRFCNETLRAVCWAHAIPQCDVSTCARTDARDGGVDTRIARGIAEKDPFGYFGSPSIWQFRASDEGRVTEAAIRAEVKKPHASRCIEAGDAYRICVCAHIADDKKQALELALNTEVASINRHAPTARVLSIEDIAIVANSFPALIMRWKRPGLDALCLHFEAWSAIATTVTSVFIPNSGFDAIRSKLLSHVDFAVTVIEPVITVQGEAGVGKTRTVYESLRHLQNAASSLVLYTDNEESAIEVSTQLANDSTSTAIIVADECSPNVQEALNRRLVACRARVRCICIDNSAERLATAAPTLMCRKLRSGELEEILRANFKRIPLDRIRTYAHVAEGFVRLAADMCQYDSQIAQAGAITPFANKVEVYYRDRLRSEDGMKAVEAIALLKRVRHKGDTPTEFEELCAFLGLDKRTAEQQLGSIKDTPGFVERGALYYRITPQLIAMIAFSAAWKRWAAGREREFLIGLPSSIQESFLRRVSENPDETIRNSVREFFRDFAEHFTPKNLDNVDLVKKLMLLVEMDPQVYLPLLQRVVTSASHEELTAGPQWTGSSWGPRRQLVWLAERFGQFPEFFFACEQILFVLAQHECETDIGNNATKIWQQFFRMQLSGTAVPFRSRLELLRRRIDEANASDAGLLAGAVKALLDFFTSRMLGPPVIGGRIPPPEWLPRTTEELKGCLQSALHLVDDVTRKPFPELAGAAKEIFLEYVVTLAGRGWLDLLKPIVAASSISEEDRARLVIRLKTLLAVWKEPEHRSPGRRYSEELEAWTSAIEPDSYHGQLVAATSGRHWDHYGREDSWRAELQRLADEFLRDPALFDQEIGWLTSSRANSAFDFGQALGTKDVQCSLLPRIFDRSAEAEIAFARGYVSGLIQGAKVDPAPVNAALDNREAAHPMFVFHVALAGGRAVHLFDRAVRLFRDNAIEPDQLRNLIFWVGEERISLAQTLTFLGLLLPRAESGNIESGDVAIELLGARLHSRELQALLDIDAALVWRVLSSFAARPGNEAFWWGQIMAAVVSHNAALAIHLATTAMVGDSFELSEEASNLLCSWANQYPAEVMDEIGKLMLRDAIGWRFFVSKFPVFAALPANTVIQWLERAGVEGARRVARHLPKPYVNESGAPVVPPLTDFVLKTFEHDDRTFSEFCAGVHSLQSYTGDIASTHEAEAAVGRAFLSHPSRRIREWGRIEYDSGRAEAQRFREWDDEIG